MKDPCAGCKVEYPRCRRICPIGVRYQMAMQAEREQIRAEQRKVSQFNAYKVDRIHETKKKAHIE